MTITRRSVVGGIGLALFATAAQAQDFPNLCQQ
jgi:hypothetical protein